MKLLSRWENADVLGTGEVSGNCDSAQSADLTQGTLGVRDCPQEANERVCYESPSRRGGCRHPGPAEAGGEACVLLTGCGFPLRWRAQHAMTERWRCRPKRSSPRPPTPSKDSGCSAWPGALQASKGLAGRTRALGWREVEEKGRAQPGEADASVAS